MGSRYGRRATADGSQTQSALLIAVPGLLRECDGTQAAYGS